METHGPEPTKEERKAIYFKRYYRDNLDSIKEKKRRYSKDNSESLAAKSRQWHKENPERSLWVSAKARAKRQEVPFEILPEDLVIPDICPVLGIPLVVKAGKRTDNTPSLDKIKADLGYVKDNISIISWRANRLKSDASLEELEKLCEYVRKSLTT